MTYAGDKFCVDLGNDASGIRLHTGDAKSRFLDIADRRQDGLAQRIGFTLEVDACHLIGRADRSVITAGFVQRLGVVLGMLGRGEHQSEFVVGHNSILSLSEGMRQPGDEYILHDFLDFGELKKCEFGSRLARDGGSKGCPRCALADLRSVASIPTASRTLSVRECVCWDAHPLLGPGCCVGLADYTCERFQA